MGLCGSQMAAHSQYGGPLPRNILSLRKDLSKAGCLLCYCPCLNEKIFFYFIRKALNTLAAIAGPTCSDQIRSGIRSTLVLLNNVAGCIGRLAAIPTFPAVQQ